MKPDVRIAQIEQSISRTEAEIAALDVYLATPGNSSVAAHELRDDLEMKLKRQQRALRVAQLAKRLAAPLVDPSQTDIEREVEAESAAHGPDLGGSRRRGR